MKTQYKKNTIYYMLTQYVQIILTIIYGVILIPFYLRYISTEMYGVWMATGNIMMWLSILMPDWSQLILQQLGVAYGAEDREEFSRILVCGIIIAISFGLVFYTVSWSASFFFEGWLNLPVGFELASLTNAFLLAAVGTALTVLGVTFSSVNLALQHTVSAGMANIAAMVVRVVSVVILLRQGYGILSLGYGNMLYGTTVLVVNVLFTVKFVWPMGLRFIFDFKALFKLIQLTAYSSLNKFGNIVSKQMEFFLVTRYLGGEEATMLKIIKVVPETLLLFATNVSVALMPAVSHSKGAGTIKDKMDALMKFTGIMFAFSCYLGGGIYELQETFVTLWVDSGIFAGQKIVFLVVANTVIVGVADTFGRYVFTVGKIKAVATARSISAVCQAGVMLAGLLLWGMEGMLIGAIMVACGLAMVFMIILIRAEKIPFLLWMVPIREFLLGLCAAVLSVAFVHPPLQASWKGLMLTGTLYTIGFAVLLVCISKNTRLYLVAVLRFLKKRFGFL
ncbi:hypothetical protein Dalk_1324 [Desulfatibacillum aliphaticivorans]|uniref:Polysaccharide biosynthesis protein n=1 Tax=Desulfatibacillum aliphaticivorans TaxID=218208 RepID=B8F9S9_DESAL|nr:hypothetical protein [Desulfatibacillum aliphaticivorans]ACL03025.1 hypothetical protein Dalk_1324 [Desulfatibacillum aliphaticivorans]